MLESLTALLLAAHLWSVNLGAAAPLLGVMLIWRSARGSQEPLVHAARRAVVTALFALIVAAATGLAVAGLMWLTGDRGLFEVLPRFAYKIHWAVWELVFTIVCLFGYLALSAARWQGRSWVTWVQCLLAVLASTNLLYHFPPLFAVMSLAADRPDLVSARVGPAEFRSLAWQGYPLALTCHFGLASLAVSGVVVMHQLGRIVSADGRIQEVDAALRRCAQTALVATTSQIAVGIWMMLSVGTLAQHRLLGGDVPGSVSLLLGVLLTFWLLHELAGASFRSVTHADTRRIILVLMLLVLSMTVTLRRLSSPRSSSTSPRQEREQIADLTGGQRV